MTPPSTDETVTYPMAPGAAGTLGAAAPTPPAEMGVGMSAPAASPSSPIMSGSPAAMMPSGTVGGIASGAGAGMPGAGAGMSGASVNGSDDSDLTAPGVDSDDDATAMGGGSMANGACCSDGDCLCHGAEPSGLTSREGPYATDSYTIRGAGCVYYPTDAEPPFAAVTVSDGFLGSGGCGSFQTGRWGPLYASHGIVAMIVDTGSSDQPRARGQALIEGIAAFKAENENSSSPLFGKMSGRYGTSGFSMGGGGTTYAAAEDSTLRTNIAIMPWGPVSQAVTVPTLVICGSSDGTAPCRSHGTPFFNRLGDIPKMRITVSSGHAGQPSSGGGASGEAGLAFQKVFLEGDERWRPLLAGVRADESNIQ